MLWQSFSMRIGFILGLTMLSQLSTLRAQTNVAHHVQFEPAIRGFEARDKTNPPPKDAVLLIGSSSIRMWTNAATQLSGHAIINRGFGGSHLSDSIAFVDRIVLPYQPKVILLYAGDNDLAAGKSTTQVFNNFKEFVAKVQAGLPKAKIGFISIKPSPSREKLLPQSREANALIREFTKMDDRLFYVDIFTPMLDANDRPREELFIKDRLHMNPKGYEIWAGIIKPLLDQLATTSK
jgi:lysophospholipase L1-like esterase